MENMELFLVVLLFMFIEVILVGDIVMIIGVLFFILDFGLVNFFVV